ncbi:MAG: GAF domain-containing protein [Cyanobacteria bacterium]|nr:GAF domain-containing protein [Cyanobacteriota bacterium]
MTAYYEPSNRQRLDGRSAESRSAESRAGEGRGSGGAPTAPNASNGNGHGNGADRGDRAMPADLDRFQAAIEALKAELERSGRPDRFLLEKMEEIEQFAATVGHGDLILSQGGEDWGGGDRGLAVAQHIRRAMNLEAALEAGVQEVQQVLQCDRVAIVRLDGDRQGTIDAEATTYGWRPTRGMGVPLAVFGGDRAEDYLDRPSFMLTTPADASNYQRQLLDRHQIQAFVAMPILAGPQLWGLLVAQQCTAPRQWTAGDRALLDRTATELALAIATHGTGSTHSSGDRTLERITDSLRHADRVATLVDRACAELRQVLNSDRVTVYRFNNDWSGEFIAEATGPGRWKPLLGTTSRDTYFDAIKGTLNGRRDPYVADDIYQSRLGNCFVQSMEAYDCRAYLVIPLYVQNNLWGLLAAYQNTEPRAWSDPEISLAAQVADQLGQSIQQVGSIEKLQQQVARQKSLATIVDKVHQFLDLNTIMQTTNDELRILLTVDRAAVYKFNDDWSGDFVSESVERPWTPLLNKSFRDTYFERTQGGRYVKGETLAVEDIFTQDYDPCHLKLLEKFECRAYIIAPVIANDKLWGLLAVYQNDRVRYWEQEEVELVTQMGLQMGVAVQQAEYLRQLETQKRQLEKASQQERAITTIVNQIRQTLDLTTIFETTTRELRKLMRVDRAAIFRYHPDWSGEFLAESVGPAWQKLVGTDTGFVQDSYIQKNSGGDQRQGKTAIVNDIYKGGLSACFIELVESFQAKAYIVAPIFKGSDLWGLLAVYQNDRPREWEELDGQIVTRLGTQLGVALEQAEFVQQLQSQASRLQKAAEQDKAIAATIDKIRASLDIATIFRTTTTELRQLLEVDRVGIYRFNQDWSGEFIAESVGTGWTKLLEEQEMNQRLRDNISNCDRMAQLRGSGQSQVDDTYLMKAQGGRYREGKSFSVNDIYQANFTPCYLSVLERFQAKAYTIAPIFKGDRLWGLLAVYQNSQPRHWEDSEINFVVQVGAQLGIALQQAETLEELRQKSQQLEEAANRDKAAKEDLQRKALNLLMAVRPALEGDLTVRAPITEDEVGTIADAYNNTLQSLRQIVLQLQRTAAKVSATSQLSSSSIADLSGKAQTQYQELTRAVSQIETMVSAAEAVRENAEQVNVAVRQANETVRSGDAAMNQTVDAILAIRETVAETGRKIRSLSESSQKISKIVSLIGNFTTQTQLLALNAAIEATRAGEYGRGFTVVADEVRSLARQSADATTEIEALVEEIQTETSEVAAAMEAGIQQVAEGTNLVSDTRQSLSNIVQVTEQIGHLVEGIAEAALSQAQQSQSVTQTMTDVAQVANRTSADSVALTASFQELLAIAEELQASVGQFKVN